MRRILVVSALAGALVGLAVPAHADCVNVCDAGNTSASLSTQPIGDIFHVDQVCVLERSCPTG